VWVPAVVFLAATSQWGWAVFMFIWGMGVSVSDNLLRPFLISSQVPISTLAVFIGVIGGVSAFGMIGVIIGPVLLTVIAALLRFLDETLSPSRTQITEKHCAIGALANGARCTRRGSSLNDGGHLHGICRNGSNPRCQAVGSKKWPGF